MFKRLLLFCLVVAVCGPACGRKKKHKAGDVPQTPVCTVSAEVCDAVDNDCDGAIDEGTAEELGCDVEGSCVEGSCDPCNQGACVCAVESRCDGACVDLQSDAAHCGICDNPCMLPNASASCVTRNAFSQPAMPALVTASTMCPAAKRR